LKSKYALAQGHGFHAGKKQAHQQRKNAFAFADALKLEQPRRQQLERIAWQSGQDGQRGRYLQQQQQPVLQPFGRGQGAVGGHKKCYSFAHAPVCISWPWAGFASSVFVRFCKSMGVAFPSIPVCVPHSASGLAFTPASEVTLPAAIKIPAWHQPQAFLRKVGRHQRLLKDDPERFGFNLLRFSNPGRFQDKLLDVLRAPPLHLRVPAAAMETRVTDSAGLGFRRIGHFDGRGPFDGVGWRRPSALVVEGEFPASIE
jgi:hypothetical protein